MTSVLTASGLSLHTPGARPLIRDLTMVLEARDRVAIVGRNGVGKSTLLRALAGDIDPDRGTVRCEARRHLVPQLVHPGGLSPGQAQRRRLEQAFEASADLLLLDEPTHDLDAEGIDWLVARLDRWDGALLVVTHERRLLRAFGDFFVVAESGCRHVRGTFEHLRDDLERRADAEQQRYVRTLNDLLAKEHAHERTRRRRERKKNRGRIRELKRASPRSVLNGKRSYAQQSQARRDHIQQDRLDRARAWAKATRRALAVELPLEIAIPEAPRPADPLVALEGVSMDGLFPRLDVAVQDQRLAIEGPNGAGKSTLLEIMMGERTPTSGRVRTRRERITYVAQGGRNWRLDDTLLERLCAPMDDAAALLRAHRFPFALADRPLGDLSPGERLRAALICGFAQEPELLVLDEPTDHLDFAGVEALERVLRTWRGGLVVVSHDAEFLDAIGIDGRVELPPRLSSRRAWAWPAARGHRRPPARTCRPVPSS